MREREKKRKRERETVHNMGMKVPREGIFFFFLIFSALKAKKNLS